MTQSPRRHDDALLNMLPLSDRAKADLVRRMSEPSRHYHTMAHLDRMWERHRRYGPATNLRGSAVEIPIALAIAYHDSVYIGGAADNEERSAVLWLEVSAAGDAVDEADRIWVADTIRATAAHVAAAAAIDRDDPRGHARQWVLDLDLTPLGETPDLFDDNMKRLAAELPHLSPAHRHENLLDALRHFAKAQPLYRCQEIASAFEQQAQENFRRYLRDDEVPALAARRGMAAGRR